jgi:hypothetical protein
MEDEKRFVIVFVGPVADADFARSVLDGNGFDTFIADEVAGTWLQGYGGSAGAVKIAVPESQADEARALLEHPASKEEDSDQ